MASNRKKRWNPKYWSKYGVPTAAPGDLMESWLKFPENKRKAEFARRKETWQKEEFAKRKEAWRKEEFQKRKLVHNKKELEKRVEEVKDEKIIKDKKSVDKYENMGYNRLKQEAKIKGIKNYWRKKREQLIEDLDSLKADS
tara:strand:- start:1216 stop:1638 length:423 start_codon:yes stop_codon:yes gene_type:complete